MSDNKTQPPVEYRRLGKSGLRVSVPILGTMSFGSDKWADWVLNEDKSLPILKAAWERGITTWDTANMYSNGESERIIGKAIKEFNIPRVKLVLLTKCFGPVGEDPSIPFAALFKIANTRDYINQGGLSRAAIFNQVNASMERLGTDYIDLLQIHRYDPNTPAEETMKALHDLVTMGKVRYIGASSMWAWQLVHYNHVAEMNGWTKFISMQGSYNLLYREEEREMNKYCDFAGLGLIPWGPLAAGQLARPAGVSSVRSEFTKNRSAAVYKASESSADEQIIARVEEVAKKLGWTMSQVSLAWMLTKVTSPIVGISSEKRLEEAIIGERKLSEEDIKYLEDPYLPKKVVGHF